MERKSSGRMCMKWVAVACAALLPPVSGLCDGPAQPVVWAYWGHEPSEFLKRKGGTGIFTIGDWLPKWYDRMHGEELIAKAAAAGVNTVYCHFFKGFGLKHEHDNMERTREFVEIAHRHGVKVLGYCSFGTVFYETMKDEVPDLETWVCRGYDGAMLTYPRQYYRWQPCREGRAYVEYFKKVISYGLRHVGLDGFHFDNSSVQECFCERCEKAFREWLAANVADPQEACGLAHFRNVRIPPDPPASIGEEIHDPMVLWRDRFRHERHDAVLSEIFDHVRREGGTVIAHNNPVLHNVFRICGSYLPGAWKSDLIFSENGRVIRRENGRNITQILAYKASRRMGFGLLDSNWPRVDGKHAMPESEDLANRFFAQGMIYGNICGTHWLTRSLKRGDRVVMDDPVRYAIASNAFAFFRENANLYNGSPVARTRLLFAKDTMYGWNGDPHVYHDGSKKNMQRQNGHLAFIELGDRLNDAGVPYLFTLEDDLDAIQPGELLVLPDMRYVNSTLHRRIVAAAARGVRILATGKYGLYDENGRERDLDSPVIGLSEVKGVLRDIPDDVRIKVCGADGQELGGIMVETTVNGSGDFVFHMLRPDNSVTIDVADVSLREPRLLGMASAQLRSLDPDCRLEKAEFPGGGVVSLRVRGLRTMASIAFAKTK